LLKLYAEADLFCLPSCENSEAFGLVMVEAMACGLPVISTDLPTGVRAVNQHNVTGLVVEPGNVNALSAAINTVIADLALRRRMGAAGRLRAARHFNRDLMAQRILDLYSDVLGVGEKSKPAEQLALTVNTR
jgi:glycosyltransferase involved in cell wall biosynthesis